jgi:hypothetical protein
MWRSLLAVLFLYGYGHPGFDALRPGMLDHSLQGFYRDVNAVVRDGHSVLTNLDQTAAVRYLINHLGRMQGEWERAAYNGPAEDTVR